MNRAEHILDVVGEEGSEVAQRVSKALRFGLLEMQPGQDETNAERIRGEFYDLIGAYGMAVNEGLLPPMNLEPGHVQALIAYKTERVERFMALARESGALVEQDGAAS